VTATPCSAAATSGWRPRLHPAAELQLAPVCGAGHRTGTFPEGKGQQNFGRVGLEWRSRDWWAEAEVSGSSFGQGSKTGARVAAAYDIDDHWQLSAAANWRSRATPLRALHNGITSNSVELGLRWRQSELREWSVGITPSHFSDGNHRTELLVTGKERLMTRTTWFLDLGIEGYAARNSAPMCRTTARAAKWG
jgi:biofilm PGA synthesis protein PgaA